MEAATAHPPRGQIRFHRLFRRGRLLADSATLQAKGKGETRAEGTAVRDCALRTLTELTRGDAAAIVCLLWLFPGYHLFLVTDTSFHYLQTSKDTFLI